MSASPESRRLHYELTNVGLRAQATATGLVQHCVELQRVNVLNEESVGGIKAAIADEILISVPRHVVCSTFKDDLKACLDRIFRGEQELGTGDSLALPSTKRSCTTTHFRSLTHLVPLPESSRSLMCADRLLWLLQLAARRGLIGTNPLFAIIQEVGRFRLKTSPDKCPIRAGGRLF